MGTQSNQTSILEQNVKSATVCADVAPMEAQGALQGPIQAALQSAQDEDRARTSAAAEALAGIVASSSTHEAASGTPCNHACCVTRAVLLFSSALA